MEWENQDLFPITEGRHKNMWFTSMNFHLANVRTQACGRIVKHYVEAIKCHIDYDDRTVLTASDFQRKKVLGVFRNTPHTAIP